MKPFFALYVKELKAHKILFLFLLLLIAGLNAYGLIRIADGLNFEEAFKQIFILTTIAIFLVLLSLPFLLAHTFNSEWRSETHYQMFALPVSQYTVILAKIVAVASVGFVGGGIVIGSVYFSMAHIVDLLVEVASIFREAVIPFFDFVLIASLILVTYMIFIFGIVIGMEGVKFSVKRYRRLTAVASFFVFFLVGFFTLQGLRVFTSFLMPMLPYPHTGSFISMYIGTGIDPYLYTTLTGIIFMIIGLVMYEKRAEI